jgi:uncharacterized membrane protein
MIVAALLSAIHLLTLALGLGAVVWRGRALASPLDDRGWGNVLAADTAWGIAAGLWIASGVARLFFGGKDSASIRTTGSSGSRWRSSRRCSCWSWRR